MFFALITTVNAQKPKAGGFDVDKIRREKAEFLKKELSLTDAEAKSFLPMEAEFTSKRFQLNRAARQQTRELRKKDNKSDADFKRITEINLDAETKEAALQKQYYEKFATILSAEKIERYRRADIKFMEMLLQRRKNN